MFFPVGAGDRIGAQQRLAVVAGQADHHELARPEAEAGRAGDGEAEEGIVWEALMAAAHYKLDNLVIIFDNNDYKDKVGSYVDMEK